MPVCVNPLTIPRPNLCTDFCHPVILPVPELGVAPAGLAPGTQSTPHPTERTCVGIYLPSCGEYRVCPGLGTRKQVSINIDAQVVTGLGSCGAFDFERSSHLPSGGPGASALCLGPSRSSLILPGVPIGGSDLEGPFLCLLDVTHSL